MVAWVELQRSTDHVFYNRLQAKLFTAGFGGFVEGEYARYCAARRGRPTLPPARYFRMLLISNFERVVSEQSRG